MPTSGPWATIGGPAIAGQAAVAVAAEVPDLHLKRGMARQSMPQEAEMESVRSRKAPVAMLLAVVVT